MLSVHVCGDVPSSESIIELETGAPEADGKGYKKVNLQRGTEMLWQESLMKLPVMSHNSH